MPSVEQRKALLTVIGSFGEATWDSDLGTLRVRDSRTPLSFDFLRELGASLRINFLTVTAGLSDLDFDRGKGGAFPIGTTLELSGQRSGTGFYFFPNFDTLIDVWRYGENPPSEYCVCESGAPPCPVLWPDSNCTEHRRFHDAVRLWEALKRGASFCDSDRSLRYVSSGLRTIKKQMSKGDLVNEIRWQIIDHFVDDAVQKEARMEVFRSAVCDFLKDQTSENSFSSILRGSEAFERRVKEGWNVYLTSISPEKLANEARSKALEISEKLEKLVTSAELKGLSIPAVILLSVKDVATGKGFTMINSVILFSTFIYILAMVFAFHSQRMMLRTVRRNLETVTSDALDKGLARDNPVFSGLISDLADRITRLDDFSCIALFCSALPFLFVVASMFLFGN